MTTNTEAASLCDAFRLANAAALIHLDPEAVAVNASLTEASRILGEVSFLRDACNEFLRELHAALEHPR